MKFVVAMCLLPNFMQLDFYFPRGMYPCATCGIGSHINTSSSASAQSRAVRLAKTTRAIKSSDCWWAALGVAAQLGSSHVGEIVDNAILGTSSDLKGGSLYVGKLGFLFASWKFPFKVTMEA